MPTDNLPAARTPVAVDLSKPLTNLDEALRLADALSRSELVPRALAGKPSNVFHVLMTGQALGLHWTESIRVIYSAGPGQIGIRGAFLLSRVRQAGHRYSITEEPDSCTFRLTRGDTAEEFAATFTIEDAIRGGLIKRNANGALVALSRDNKPLPWMTWTKRMLRWRAVSDCVSFAAPEVALGFEIEGSEPEPEPEVMLKPHDGGPAHTGDDGQTSHGGPASASAPPAPAAGEAATGDGQAAQARLAELDRAAKMPADAASPVHLAGPEGNLPVAPADAKLGGNPPAEPAAREAADAPAENQARQPGSRAQVEQSLAAQFTELGWEPKRFRADMLRACTMFAGRRIKSVRDLTTVEIAQLSVRLSAIGKEHNPEHQPVALADAVEEWREKFAETDPDGYEKLEEK
jgi:hypothetical protein